MNLTFHSILIVSLILTIVSMIKPALPPLQVAVLLICVALLATWYN